MKWLFSAARLSNEDIKLLKYNVLLTVWQYYEGSNERRQMTCEKMTDSEEYANSNRNEAVMSAKGILKKKYNEMIMV